MSAAAFLWRAASSALFPLFRRRLRSARPEGFDERCGVYERGKLDFAKNEPVVWIHAVSVGEVQAAVPYAAEARRSGFGGSIVLSTVTGTGAKIAGELAAPYIDARVYAPWDVPSIVKKSCEAINPSLYVTVETEVWPNILSETRRRGVPSVLLNARVSDRTMRRARHFGGVLREAFGLFGLILARGEEDARRLIAIGVPKEKIKINGDCKIDAIFGRIGDAKKNIPALKKKLGLRESDFCFVAGSVHEGEDEIVLKVFSRLRDAGIFPGAKLVVVPRHPERARAVAALASRFGTARLFSETDGRGTEDEIIIVDTIGILFALYGTARAAFVGGSLVPRGGQNILEPAAWGTPVLHGPHMEDFAEPAKAFGESGAAFRVENEDEMFAVLSALKDAPENSRRVPEWLAERRGAASRAWKISRAVLGGGRDAL